MYKIHTYRGGFCNILIFNLLRALLAVLFNSLQVLLVVLFNPLQALLVVMPSRFGYNLAIATIPCSKQLSQFSSQDVLAYYRQDFRVKMYWHITVKMFWYTTVKMFWHTSVKLY